jgi:RHS repeat-associated protein
MPLAQVDIANSYTLSYIHPDHLNTPQKMTNTSQAIVWDLITDPYGRQHSLTATSPRTENPRFAGQYFDAESGYHYNYFRDYDPKTGRYLQSDPIGLDGGINTYRYAEANPMRFTDPTGENALLGLYFAALGAWLNLDYQLYMNDGDTNCLDPNKVVGTALAVATVAFPAPRILTLIKLARNVSSKIPKSPKNFIPPTNEPSLPDIPPGYVSEPADTGRGVVYRQPGTEGRANTIRVMQSTEEYPNGYWIQHNQSGQPINPINGRTGMPHETHVPLPGK